jgi:hypothetical protein
MTQCHADAAKWSEICHPGLVRPLISGFLDRNPFILIFERTTGELP